MWSKTRKALNDRLADCLKNRVNYNFMVYTSMLIKRPGLPQIQCSTALQENI